MSTQTLSQGTSLPQDYAKKLGGARNLVVPPNPNTLFGALRGESNVGKSSFLQSNPNCFLINVEAMPITNPKLKAYLWPFRDSNGLPCEQCEAGTDSAYQDPVLRKQGIEWVRPLFLTWEDVQKKVDLIIQMRKDGVPGTPTLIALDTVSGGLKLLEDWVVRNSVTLGISQEPKENFSQLHGPSAYDEMYSELLDIGLRCRKAGLGFLWVIHLGWRELFDKNTRQRIGKELDYNMTANLWMRMFSWWECVVAVCVRGKTELIDATPIKLPDGRLVPQGKKQVTSKERFLVVDAPVGDDLSPIVKRKVKIPGEVIITSEENAWDCFVEAYNKSAILT